MLSIAIRTYPELGPSDSLRICADGMAIHSVTVHVEFIAIDAVYHEDERTHRITICSRLSSNRMLALLRTYPCSDPTILLCVVSIEPKSILDATDPGKDRLVIPALTEFGEVLEIPVAPRQMPYKYVVVQDSEGSVLGVTTVLR